VKQIIFITVILLASSALHAQKRDSTSTFVFSKHEIKLSYGDAFNAMADTMDIIMNNAHFKANFTISYAYRHKKWLWFGINAVNYIGKPIRYDMREYDVNGKYVDYRYTTKDHGFGFLPAIRFSYLNREKTTLYSGIEVFGCFWIKSHTDGMPNKMEKTLAYHLTYFGWSSYLDESRKVFIGGELGAGYRGVINIHGGYRF
jgi:hypothetical protein